MKFNEYKSTTDKSIIDINYRTAQEYEKCKKYKEAIKLYQKNIFKYDHNLSKVNLAKLYISGNLGITNNKKARELLEEVYENNCKEGQVLYAYMLANGIGGKKDKEKASYIFKEEMNLGNPDPMIYIELSKRLRKKENKKNISKSLRKSITRYEINQYKRKVNTDKFNNHILGRIVNYLPNKLSLYFDEMIKQKEYNKFSYNLYELYNKAEIYNDSGEYDTARRIYKRLVQYDDNDSKIKYAKMCYKGIGGKKDIKSAKEIYEEFIIRKNRKLSQISNKLNDMFDLLEYSQKQQGQKQSLKEKRINKNYKNNILEEIEYLKSKKNKILLYQNYKEAELNYGLLLVDNYSNQEELDRGITFLKHIAIQGEKATPKGYKKSKIAKLNDKRARIAILKLGKLYEKGIWKPKNIDEEREMFYRFSTGKISRYTSYISDKMKSNEKITYMPKSEKDIISMKKGKKRSKKCNIRYEFGMLCEILNIKKLARKSFESMHEKGDYRGDYSLARFEHLGKGGNKDYAKAKEHYRCYINSTVNAKEKTDIKIRSYAMKNLADLLLEENDVIEAVELYKNSAIMGNKNSKIALRNLYKENKWVPITQQEMNLIKLKGINKFITNISEKYEELKSNQIEENRIRKALKPIAASAAISIAISAQTANGIINKTKSDISYIPQPQVEDYIIADDKKKVPNRSLVIDKKDLYSKKENELLEYIEI